MVRVSSAVAVQASCRSHRYPAPAQSTPSPNGMAHAHEPTATLGTWRNFWGSRVAYFEAHGMPTQLVDFVTGLLDSAIGEGGGAKRPHADADVTRLQEVVRYRA